MAKLANSFITAISDDPRPPATGEITELLGNTLLCTAEPPVGVMDLPMIISQANKRKLFAMAHNQPLEIRWATMKVPKVSIEYKENYQIPKKYCEQVTDERERKEDLKHVLTTIKTKPEDVKAIGDLGIFTFQDLLNATRKFQTEKYISISLNTRDELTSVILWFHELSAKNETTKLPKIQDELTTDGWSAWYSKMKDRVELNESFRSFVEGDMFEVPMEDSSDYMNTIEALRLPPVLLSLFVNVGAYKQGVKKSRDNFEKKDNVPELIPCYWSQPVLNNRCPEIADVEKIRECLYSNNNKKDVSADYTVMPYIIQESTEESKRYGQKVSCSIDSMQVLEGDLVIKSLEYEQTECESFFQFITGENYGKMYQDGAMEANSTSKSEDSEPVEQPLKKDNKNPEKDSDDSDKDSDKEVTKQKNKPTFKSKKKTTEAAVPKTNKNKRKLDSVKEGPEPAKKRKDEKNPSKRWELVASDINKDGAESLEGVDRNGDKIAGGPNVNNLVQVLQNESMDPEELKKGLMQNQERQHVLENKNTIIFARALQHMADKYGDFSTSKMMVQLHNDLVNHLHEKPDATWMKNDVDDYSSIYIRTRMMLQAGWGIRLAVLDGGHRMIALISTIVNLLPSTDPSSYWNIPVKPVTDSNLKVDMKKISRRAGTVITWPMWSENENGLYNWKVSKMIGYKCQVKLICFGKKLVSWGCPPDHTYFLL